MRSAQRFSSYTTNSHPMIEALEDRQMMSVAPHPALLAAPSRAKVAAVVASAKAAAKPPAKTVAKTLVRPKATAVPTNVPSPGPVKASSVVGAWTGSMRLDGTSIDNAFSVTFLFQRGVAATGTFNLGATMGNAVVTSTMVFSLHNNIRVLVATPGLNAGFTGAMSTNGKILNGRFSFNSPKGWQTGMFTLTRN
jgi:hypothetical protein